MGLIVREQHDPKEGDMGFSVSLTGFTHSRSTIRLLEDIFGPAQWVPEEGGPASRSEEEAA